MRVVRPRPAGRARIVGSAGRSTARAYRQRAATYRQLPPQTTLTVAALVVGLASTLANMTGAPVPLVAVASAGVMLLAHLSLRYPAQTAAAAVAIVYLLVTPIVGAVHAAAAGWPSAGGVGDPLAILALTAAVAAVRYSRRPPWRTTGRALLLAAAAPVPLLRLAPAPGMTYAAAAVLLVLAWDAGAVHRLAAGLAAALAPLRRLRPSDLPETVRADRHAAAAQQQIGLLLADLDGQHVVLHDRLVPGHPQPVDHVVLGPAGLVVISTLRLPGVIREDPERGLHCNGRALGGVLGQSLAAAQAVADTLNVDAALVRAVTVVHDAVLPAARTRTELTDTAAGWPAGEVLLLAPDALADEVTFAGQVLSRAQVHRLARTAARRLLPASAADRKSADAGRDEAPAGRAVNATGRPLPLAQADTPPGQSRTHEEPAPPSEQEPERVGPRPLMLSTDVDVQVLPGQRVTLMTDDGMYPGFRIAGEPLHQDDNAPTVAVCTEEDWQRHHGQVPDAKTAPYPLASVLPDPAGR
jgi:hypothetical protein